MADIAASVLAKLRNKAKASGISYQQCLQLFVQEEFLRKLSKSGCEDTLILKGGLFIYTLTNFESRATIDVDFLLRGYSNTIDDVKELICKIIDTPTGNDYIEMRAKGFEEISPQRKYHGKINNLMSSLDALKADKNYSKISVQLTSEELEVLVGRIYEYTLKLASDNEIEITADDLGKEKDAIRNLQSYLKLQRRIFAEAA